jgi:hypothetical protein
MYRLNTGNRRFQLSFARSILCTGAYKQNKKNTFQSQT